MDLKSIGIGIVIGILFTVTFTVLSLFLANRRFIKKSMKAQNPIENDTIKEIIKQKQKRILKSKKLGINPNFQLIDALTRELVTDIATFYYPTSKHPELEISLYEALDLTEKVSVRLKNILDFKAISPIQNLRLSQIKMLLDMKKTIGDNKLYQFSKKYKLEKVAKLGIATVNVANPAYWIGRVILTSTIESSLRGIGVMTLHVVGEEAYQLYSKKILDNKDKLLEKELNRFIKEIDSAVMV